MRGYLMLVCVVCLTWAAQVEAQEDRGGVTSAVLTLKEMKSEKRIALVIGNGSYKNAPLANPTNDARLMSKALRDLGFEVISATDLDQKGMKRAIIDFGRRLRESGGVGLFYFAGHGMQIQGRNYLIPIGALIESEADVEIEAVEVGAVLAKMEGAENRLNIVVLDACRNNPFARAWRSQSRGLASINAPKGTLIAYATAPGSVASDGAGSNGTYTGALAKEMTTRGARIEDVFKAVRTEVRVASKDQQVPWESSSMEGDFYFSLPSELSSGPDPVIRANDPPSVDPQCPFGQRITSETEGNCCWPGQLWKDGACFGLPIECPSGSAPDATAQSCTCGEGMVRAEDGGHCCYEGQVWSSAQDRCVGALLECPDDSLLKGGECIALERRNAIGIGITSSYTPKLAYERLTSGHHSLFIEFGFVHSFRDETLRFLNPAPGLSFAREGTAIGFGGGTGYRYRWRGGLDSPFFGVRFDGVKYVQEGGLVIDAISGNPFSATIESPFILRLSTNIGRRLVFGSGFSMMGEVGVGGFFSAYELSCEADTVGTNSEEQLAACAADDGMDLGVFINVDLSPIGWAF